jgi:ribosomal RNA-processing protein 17
LLRERALANAAQVEKACGAILGLIVRFQVITGIHLITLSEEEQEWQGITVHGDAVRDEEYENEELLATVTVVEDFDLNANFLAPPHSKLFGTFESLSPISPQKPSQPPKTKKDRYENKHARQREQTKQRSRRTKKAELAGGRASRANKSSNKAKGKHKAKR